MTKNMAKFFLTLALLASFALQGFAQTPVWTTDGPAPRQLHSQIYDPTSDTMTVFGGQPTATGPGTNDLWFATHIAADAKPSQLSLEWVQGTPTGTLPAPRYGHSAVYDPASNRMIVFGGSLGSPAPCTSEIWNLTAANGSAATPAWTQVTATGVAPAPRFNHAAVYDPGSNSMIIFGGTNCSTGYFSDIWVLSNANSLTGTPAWTQRLVSGGPSPRELAAAVYDPAANTLTLFGGDNLSLVLGDAWVLSRANGVGGTSTWTQLAPSGTAPAARTAHTAVYDLAHNRMIIYGGKTLANLPTYFSDTWVLSNANGTGGTPAWTLVNAPAAPARSYHKSFYSASTNRMIFFGGYSATTAMIEDHIFTLEKANGLP